MRETVIKLQALERLNGPRKRLYYACPFSIQNIEFNSVFGALADLDQITSCNHSICFFFFNIRLRDLLLCVEMNAAEKKNVNLNELLCKSESTRTIRPMRIVHEKHIHTQ